MHVTSGWSISLPAGDPLSFSSFAAMMVEAGVKKESPSAWLPEQLMSRDPADPHQTCSIGRDYKQRLIPLLFCVIEMGD